MSDWSSFKIATFQTYQSTITPFQSSTPLTTTKTPSAASPGQVISTFFNNDTLSKHQNQDFQTHKIKNTCPLLAIYPRSNSPAWKRPVLSSFVDFVEAVFRLEIFPVLSGRN
ncbi:unnamed protein product [Rotaria magnacalcarata]|uniref:Uncharacterized protein n=1 Tax=Rotaria magnacalcarata TaxID=392030 RepID=A0A815P8Z6_9BILA|nr:unnamed protein product [Rotaria magnacalcarata]CAF1445716.1 unnamed protein product [Rotaria magnacalcarata]CAF2051335.1 unnamed protein product [Rotaria magnacalcarata]CAF4720235.1 unnamed protein product [Rotaria magnacalcarata]